jgi:hypothetical protein
VFGISPSFSGIIINLLANVSNLLKLKSLLYKNWLRYLKLRSLLFNVYNFHLKRFSILCMFNRRNPDGKIVWDMQWITYGRIRFVYLALVNLTRNWEQCIPQRCQTTLSHFRFLLATYIRRTYLQSRLERSGVINFNSGAGSLACHCSTVVLR